MRSLRVLLVSAFVLALGAGVASAGGISSGAPYELSVSIGGNAYTLSDLDTTYVHKDEIGGTYTLNAPAVTPFGTVTNWGSTYEFDPQVTIAPGGGVAEHGFGVQAAPAPCQKPGARQPA